MAWLSRSSVSVGIGVGRHRSTFVGVRIGVLCPSSCHSTQPVSIAFEFHLLLVYVLDLISLSVCCVFHLLVSSSVDMCRFDPSRCAFSSSLCCNLLLLAVYPPSPGLFSVASPSCILLLLYPPAPVSSSSYVLLVLYSCPLSSSSSCPITLRLCSLVSWNILLAVACTR